MHRETVTRKLGVIKRNTSERSHPAPQPEAPQLTEPDRAIWEKAEAECGRMIASFADEQQQAAAAAERLGQRFPPSEHAQ